MRDSLVQAAFSNLHHMDDVFEKARRAGDDDGGIARLRSDPYHKARIDTVREAELIALTAGRTLRDRFHARRDQERLKNLAPVLAQAAADVPSTE